MHFSSATVNELNVNILNKFISSVSETICVMVEARDGRKLLCSMKFIIQGQVSARKMIVHGRHSINGNRRAGNLWKSVGRQ